MQKQMQLFFQVGCFLTNHADTNVIVLPDRIPGVKWSDLQLLPTHLTKKNVWSSYIKASGTLTFRLALYRTFCRIWQTYKPLLVITILRSDLCWTCQRLSQQSPISDLCWTCQRLSQQSPINHLLRNWK